MAKGLTAGVEVITGPALSKSASNIGTQAKEGSAIK
jgi:hypothetical protein